MREGILGAFLFHKTLPMDGPCFAPAPDAQGPVQHGTTRYFWLTQLAQDSKDKYCLEDLIETASNSRLKLSYLKVNLVQVPPQLNADMNMRERNGSVRAS